jgi:hypothetical protein
VLLAVVTLGATLSGGVLSGAGVDDTEAGATESAFEPAPAWQPSTSVNATRGSATPKRSVFTAPAPARREFGVACAAVSGVDAPSAATRTALRTTSHPAS